MATRFQKDIYLQYLMTEFPGAGTDDQLRVLQNISDEQLGEFVDTLIRNKGYPKVSKEVTKAVTQNYTGLSSVFLKSIDAGDRDYIINQLATLPKRTAEALAISVIKTNEGISGEESAAVAKYVVEMAKNKPEKGFLHRLAARVTEKEGGGKVFKNAINTYNQLKRTYTPEQMANMHEKFFPQVTEKGGQQVFPFTTKVARPKRGAVQSYRGRGGDNKAVQQTFSFVEEQVHSNVRKQASRKVRQGSRKAGKKVLGSLYIYGSDKISNEATIRKLLYFSGNTKYKRIISSEEGAGKFNEALLTASEKLDKKVTLVGKGSRAVPIPGRNKIGSAIIVWDKALHEEGGPRRSLDYLMREDIQTQIYVPDKRHMKSAFDAVRRAKERISQEGQQRVGGNIHIMSFNNISSLPFKSETIRKRADAFRRGSLAEYGRKFVKGNKYSDYLVDKFATKLPADASPVRTKTTQQIIDIMNDARIFVLDTETTGTAIKTDKAKIWSLSFGRYNPEGKYIGKSTNIKKVAYSKFARSEKKGVIDTIIANVELNTKDKYPKYGMVRVRNEVVSYGGKFKRYRGARGNKVITAHEAIRKSDIVNDDMFNFIVRAYQKVAGQNGKGRQVQQGGVLFMQNTNFEYSFLRRMILEGNREQRAARIASTVYNVPATFSKEVVANLPEAERMRFYYVDLEKYRSSYTLFGDTDPDLFQIKEEIRKASSEVKFGTSMRSTQKAYKDMYRNSRSYLEMVITKIADQKNNTRGLHLDLMNTMAATNALLQEAGYRKASAHIFTGTALDLLKTSITGAPMSHMSEQDVGDTSNIIKHIFENRIAPLLAGEKLSAKEIALVHLEDIASKKYQEKNIAAQVFDTYKDIISQMNTMHAEGKVGNAKYNVRLKEFLTHGDVPFAVTSVDPKNGVAVRTELSKVRTQKMSMADFEQKIVESYQNIHGSQHSEKIAKYAAEASIVYERYKRFLEQDIVTPGQGAAGERGLLSSIEYGEAMRMLSLKEEKQRSAAKIILAETSRKRAKIDQFIEEGINPKSGLKMMSLGEKVQMLFGNEHQYYDRIEEGLKVSNKISHDTLSLGKMDKEVAKDIFKAEQHSLRMRAVGLGVIGFAVMAAFSRSQREQVPDDSLRSRSKLAERFNWYFEGTGATVGNGNPFYSGGIPSTLDRSAYGKNNVLENIQPTIDTDFSSPFIKASSSTLRNQMSLNKQHTDSNAIVIQKGGLYTGERSDKQMNVEVHTKLRQSLYGGGWSDVNQGAEIF